MSAWTTALRAATESDLKLRRPSMCLAALALDDAGLTVEDLMSGVTIVTAMPAQMRDAVEALLMTVLDSGSRLRVGWPEMPSDDTVVVVRDCRRHSGWRQEASDTGRPAVVIVGEVADVHPPQAVATADRTAALRETYHPEALEAAIRMVTDEHVALGDHWPPVDFSDAVACIVKGSTALECAGRLHKLVSGRHSADDQADEGARDMTARPAQPRSPRPDHVGRRQAAVRNDGLRRRRPMGRAGGGRHSGLRHRPTRLVRSRSRRARVRPARQREDHVREGFCDGSRRRTDVDHVHRVERGGRQHRRHHEQRNDQAVRRVAQESCGGPVHSVHRRDRHHWASGRQRP